LIYATIPFYTFEIQLPGASFPGTRSTQWSMDIIFIVIDKTGSTRITVNYFSNSITDGIDIVAKSSKGII